MLHLINLRKCAILGLSGVITSGVAYSSSSWPFQTKGLNTKYLSPVNKDPPLYLAGVGMRKKKIYLIDIDVYLIGFHLSPRLLAKAKVWNKKLISERDGTLVDELLDEEATLPIPTVSPGQAGHLSTEIAMSLNFVRDVSTNQLINAFEDAFQGCDMQAEANFRNGLEVIIGPHGMRNGEVLSFYWLNSGGLVMAKGDQSMHLPPHKDIERALLGIYIDPVKSVSPELIQCINTYISDVSDSLEHK